MEMIVEDFNVVFKGKVCLTFSFFFSFSLVLFR